MNNKKMLLRIFSAVMSASLALSSGAVTLYAADAAAAAAPTEANVHVKSFMQVTEPAAAPDGGAGDKVVKDPIIIDLSTSLTASVNAVLVDIKEDDTEGKHEFVTLADGTKCLKLMYSEHKAFAPYRFMPGITNKNRGADYKYVRVTYMTEDTGAASLRITNNANSADKVTLVPNTGASKGEWIRSEAIGLAGTSILERFARGSHNTFEFVTDNKDSAFYVKEIAFFTDKEQAYEYYGEELPSDYVALTFGDGGTAGVLAGDEWGVNSVNNLDKTVEITYAEKTNHGINYMLKAGFSQSVRSTLSMDYRYVRVLYSADNPDGCVGVDLYLTNDKMGERILLSENIVDTNGEFVLSDAVYLPDVTAERIMGNGTTSTPMHVSYSTNAALEGGKYCLKAVYFFKSRAEAEAFSASGARRTLSICGNDISKYQIVVPEGTHSLYTAADAIVSQIKVLAGVTVPVVTDSAPESEYEILLGVSSREASKLGLDTLPAGEDNFNVYKAGMVGSKLVVTAENPYAVMAGVDNLLGSYMYLGLNTAPEKVDLTDVSFSGRSSKITKYGKWEPITNVDTPESFTEDFDTDDGYFTESGNADVWKLENGVYSAAAGDERADSYVQVFDANVTLGAKIKYTKADADGDMGLLLRYTAKDSYLRAGYDFDEGEWYIEYREGNDFATVRAAAKKASLTADTWYTLEFTADGGNASLTVNGEQVLSASGIVQLTPGKIGVYAENASVSVDDINALFLSGMATVMRGVSHTRLPDELFREGGSVMEQSDGTLIFRSHHSNATFKSTDGGTSWQRSTEAVFTTSAAYPGFLRLTDGTWITTARKTIDGVSYMISQTSSDDGKTWVDGGIITVGTFPSDGKGGSTANAGNMNDKITEMATTGRIFYSQNYEVTDRSKPNDGRIVFCEFFYSDDKGKTWNKSETASWEIEGNETEEWFGECKILECADGTLRMYNSWNDYGCIVYSESKDNGVTWGPIVTMPELVCAKSSMQFCRDPYSENDTTYYMVWVNSEQEEGTSGASSTMTRARLSLAKSTDGKNWDYIGDLWHWRMNYRFGNIMAHIVDPFVTATKDAIIVGTGLAEYLPVTGDLSNGHGAQREHIWTIDRDTVDETAKKINKFTDMDKGAPYYEAVTFAVDNKLFTGTSETTFAPDTVMNRSMFVTVLGRLDGVDTVKYVTPTFNDVIAGQWYTPYVEWAAANGIVNGMGDGSYGINESITVEQACTILARYNGFKTASATGKTTADFSDTASVSAWAAEAVEWAVANGVYAGQNGKLNPTAPASRALVAMMFEGYVRVFGK